MMKNFESTYTSTEKAMITYVGNHYDEVQDELKAAEAELEKATDETRKEIGRRVRSLQNAMRMAGQYSTNGRADMIDFA